MANITKAVQSLLLNNASIGSVQCVVSSTLNVNTALAAAFGIKVGHIGGQPFAPGWPVIRIEASHKDTGNDAFIPVYEYTPNPATSVSNTTINTVTAGDAVINVSSDTGFVAGDICLLSDNTNFEFVRVVNVSGTGNIYVEVGTKNSYASGTISNAAEMVFPHISLLPYKRVRAVFNQAGNNTEACVEVSCDTADSIG